MSADWKVWSEWRSWRRPDMLEHGRKWGGLWLPLALALVASGCTLFSSPCTADPERLNPGRDCVQLQLSGWPGAAPARIYTYLPRNHTPDSRVLLVVHGALRNAASYRASWEGLAEAHSILVVAPEIPRSVFRGSSGFQQGNLLTEDGALNPSERWAFQVVEQAFDQARVLAGNRSEGYYLFGHSAGGQFVHRLVWMTAGQARIAGAVAANAGWYTMPDVSVTYPYGLQGTPAAEPAAFRAALAAPLTVLLGEADTGTWSPLLRKTEEAMLQGPHRLARGQYFFAQAEMVAREQGLPFGWRLRRVPGVGHDQEEMAPAAAAVLFGEAPGGGGEHSAGG